MSTITTRIGKGDPLTFTEMDSNLTNLNSDKLENINSEIDKSMREKVLQIQMESKSYDKLTQELDIAKQKNIELKEDILFYEKIVGKRPK